MPYKMLHENDQRTFVHSNLHKNAVHIKWLAWNARTSVAALQRQHIPSVCN